MSTVTDYVGARGPSWATSTKKHHFFVLSEFVAVAGDPPDRRGVDRWVAGLDRLATGSVRSYLSSAKGFLVWLDLPDLAARLPKVRKPRHLPRALTAAQAEQLWVSLPDTRARLIVGLMLHLGLRRAEVASLRVEDFGGDFLRVRGKGGHERELPIPGTVRRLVTTYLAERPAPAGDPLVRSHAEGGEREGLEPATIGDYVSRWMTAAGVKQSPGDGVSAHACRHFAASEVLDACGDLRAVQQLLGHRELQTTAIYLRPASTAVLREALEARSRTGAAMEGAQ